MVICQNCGKRLVTPAQLEKHMTTHSDPIPDVPQTPVAPEAAPVEAAPVKETITLRFKVPVEVSINGVKYEGKAFEAPNLEIASEIVRIIRESAYGDVLER